MRLAIANGAIWSVGNGLASTSLVIYLIRQLGAEGLAIGAILSAPYIAGVLRLVAPAISARLRGKRLFCCVGFAASAMLLVVIAQLAKPGALADNAASLRAIIALWCIYHLLEFAATVVLWGWMGDLVPRRVRGRFIGMRETAMLLGRIVGMLAGGAIARLSALAFASNERWLGYAIPATLGAACMLTAILPLMRMPDSQVGVGDRLRRLIGLPLGDARLLWLMAFGVSFSIANGLTQSAQYAFPIQALALSLLARNVLDSGMRLSQAALAPVAGWISDRFGDARMLLAAQLVVATGPLFFFAASLCRPHTEHAWWWLVGAWAAWIAYVGLNVGLPATKLKLAPPAQRSAYFAWFLALNGLAYGIAAIAGGAVYQAMQNREFQWSLGAAQFDTDQTVFLAGFVMRLACVVWLIPLLRTSHSATSEPGGVRDG